MATVFKNAEQGNRLAVANTKFAFDLYQLLAKESDGNIFMSPLSISVALAMCYLGARGNTLKQMKDVLHFGEVDDSHIHQAFSDVRAALNKPNEPYTLHMANRHFGEKSYSFLQEFLNASRSHYGADLAAVDFVGDSSGATALINNWVAENTNNKITQIISPSDVNHLTRLVLVNAVYFKGDWVKQFQTRKTRESAFHISPKETVKVQLMSMSKETFAYGENAELKCQAIELPYVGDALSMFILLPDRYTSSLAELEKKLTVEDLISVREKFKMYEQEVYLELPRFRLDEKLSLADTLISMGLPDLFDDHADLSGIDGAKNLCVSRVLHRAVVEVNELGTEAAAATAVTMMLCSATLTAEFRADHPFLVFIQHKPTKSILFLGRIIRPA